MLSRAQNDLLTRVGPDTPMGRVFRRYWLPVCTSAQIAAADSAPLRVRLLGESLVAFRDTSGRVGVLEEGCMHRCASLALGRVEHGGIRCIYHGWKFAVDGTVLDIMNNTDERLLSRLRQPAYPVHEAGGVVFAYLGPAEKQPPFPTFPFLAVPDENRVVLRINVKVNYLQSLEGGLDTSHIGVLHSNVVRPQWNAAQPAQDAFYNTAPRLELTDTNFGYYYAAIRSGDVRDGRPIDNVRVTPYILPSTRIIGGGRRGGSPHVMVFEIPADDVQTSTFLVFYDDAPVDKQERLALLGLDDPRFWSEKDCNYRVGGEELWGQDRASLATNYSGFRGIELEDAAITGSMGPIVDRTKEHPLVSDMAVVRIRKLLEESARRVEEDRDPIGVRADLSQVKSVEADLPSSGRWLELVTHYQSEVHRPRYL